LKTLVDTNVILDILTGDEVWSAWSADAMRDAIIGGDVMINPIIFAELSVGFTSE